MASDSLSMEAGEVLAGWGEARVFYLLQSQKVLPSRLPFFICVCLIPQALKLAS